MSTDALEKLLIAYFGVGSILAIVAFVYHVITIGWIACL
jgi:hypothetical protein